MPDVIANNEQPDTSFSLAEAATHESAPPIEALRFVRSDGTVETAVNAEDAIRRCPVLGKMPLEQANVLIELAGMGQQAADKPDLQEKEATEISYRAEKVNIVSGKNKGEHKNLAPDKHIALKQERAAPVPVDSIERLLETKIGTQQEPEADRLVESPAKNEVNIAATNAEAKKPAIPIIEEVNIKARRPKDEIVEVKVPEQATDNPKVAAVFETTSQRIQEAERIAAEAAESSQQAEENTNQTVTIGSSEKADLPDNTETTLEAETRWQTKQTYTETVFDDAAPQPEEISQPLNKVLAIEPEADILQESLWEAAANYTFDTENTGEPWLNTETYGLSDADEELEDILMQPDVDDLIKRIELSMGSHEAGAADFSESDNEEYVAQAEDVPQPSEASNLAEAPIQERVENLLKPTSELAVEVTEQIQSLEPAEAESALSMLDDIKQAAKQAGLLPEQPSNGNEEATAKLDREHLEELCLNLFEYLGIEYSESSLEEFIEKLDYSLKLERRLLTIEDLNEAGTHEYKPGYSLSTAFAGAISENVPPLAMLGRYALY